MVRRQCRMVLQRSSSFRSCRARMCRLPGVFVAAGHLMEMRSETSFGAIRMRALQPAVPWGRGGGFDSDIRYSWRNTNGSLTICFMATGAGASWQIGGVGDFDGNLKSDILWRETAAAVPVGLVHERGNDGSHGFYANPSTSWPIRTTGDYNARTGSRLTRAAARLPSGS